MGDSAQPSMADVMKMLQTLSSNMSKMQSDMDSMQEKVTSSADSGSHQDGQHRTDHPLKFQRMEFPRYDGKSDPLIFINKCESYFRQQRTMPEEKVWMASYNMDDVAQLWFLQLQEDEGTPPWGRFKELLNLRFGPVLRSAPLFELTKCRRTGSVEEYSNRFQALLPRDGRLQESQRVKLYTGGLLPPLSHQVRVHAPESLAAAMSLARTLELVELDRISPLLDQAAPRATLSASPPRPARLRCSPCRSFQPRHSSWPSRCLLPAARLGLPSALRRRSRRNVVVLACVTIVMSRTPAGTIGCAAASSTLMASSWRTLPRGSTPSTPPHHYSPFALWLYAHL
jgi:hypothetical protein